MTAHGAALLLLALTLAARPAAGQVTTLRDLTFGVVVSGTTTSVTKTSANAAQWRIRGILGIGGGFQLTLPTTLSGPGATLPITFSSADGVYRINNTNPNGGTSFNPHTFVSITLVLLSDIYVWLGASVSPPLNQKPGTYTGTVVLTTTGLL